MSPRPVSLIQALLKEIREYCIAHADPKGVAKYARYFKEGFDAYGILNDKDGLWTEKWAQWQEKYKELGLEGFLALGDRLFESGKYEEGSLAIRFVKSYRDQFDARTVERLGQWFASGLGNWAHNDVLCGELISPFLASGKVKLQVLAPWRKSTLRFQRRAVPVSMLGLVKAGAAIEPLLKFIRPMMLDEERVVHQGLGWFLREAWKKQPKPVEEFLLEWKEESARLIYQYATEKMTPAGKERFRRAKKKK